MIQILLLKNPLLRKGLSLPQRICYLSSALFWFFPFMRMVFMAAPLLFILFNLKIYDASVEEFVAYTITYLVIGEIMRNYLFGQVRWPWVSEVYEYVQSVYLFRAIISVLINPRRPTFTVTAKGETLQETRLSELAWPYFAIVGVLLFALGVSVYRYNTEPQIGGLLLVVGAWNVLNLFVAAAALGVVTERRERRTSPRLVCLRDAVLMIDGVETAVRVNDISLGGAKVVAAPGLAVPFGGSQQSLTVLSARDGGVFGSIPVSVQDNAGDGVIGLRFNAQAEHYPIIAELMLADIDAVRAQRSARQRRQGIIAGTFGFLKWSLLYPLVATHHLIFDRDAPAQDADAVAPEKIEPNKNPLAAPLA